MYLTLNYSCTALHLVGNVSRVDLVYHSVTVTASFLIQNYIKTTCNYECC